MFCPHKQCMHFDQTNCLVLLEYCSFSKVVLQYQYQGFSIVLQYKTARLVHPWRECPVSIPCGGWQEAETLTLNRGLSRPGVAETPLFNNVRTVKVRGGHLRPDGACQSTTTRGNAWPPCCPRCYPRQ